MSARVMSSATLGSLTWSEFKSFLREPPGNIFALVIPLVALIASGIAFGNVPDGTAGVYGPTDLTMPGQLAATIAAAGFMVVPVPFIRYRRRAAQLSDDKPDSPPFGGFFQAQLLVALAVILAGTIAVLVVGSIVFGIRPPVAPFALAAGFILCCGSIVAIGIVLGALIPTVLMARAIGLVLFLLNLMASGSAIPEGQLPAILKGVGTVMPLTYVRRLLADLWFGRGWNGLALLILAVVLLAAGAAALRLYRRGGALNLPGGRSALAVTSTGRGGRHDTERS